MTTDKERGQEEDESVRRMFRGFDTSELIINTVSVEQCTNQRDVANKTTREVHSSELKTTSETRPVCNVCPRAHVRSLCGRKPVRMC